MNKKLIILIGALVASVLAIGAATSGAWFTDQEKVEVTATAGKLDVQLTVAELNLPTTPCQAPVVSNPNTVPWTASGLEPGGVAQSRCINIKNVESIPVKFRFTSEYLGYDWAWLNLKVQQFNCPNGANIGPVPAYDGPVSGLNVVNAGPLAQGDEDCYRFDLYVPETVSNGYQGYTAKFNIVADATQPSNPAF
jgi:predicted ribosomally synthesized peptide with SipW-like signal peptide